MIQKYDLPKDYEWVNIDNIQFNQALDEVLNGDDNIFVQAKAGCGKSLIIKIASLKLDNLVVLSTTGTTAVQLSSDGVPAKTIHSFFQFGPTSIIEQKDQFKLYGSARDVMKKAETIIIDEVSMLNAQIFDAMITKLKFIRKGTLPRLILFGDVLQLPPVIEAGVIQNFFEENYHGNVMFFNSNAYKALNFRMMTLNKSYRQTDGTFADTIYQVGVGMVSQSTLDYFNQRVMSLPKYEVGRKHFIYMATTNAIVNRINREYIESFNSDKWKTFKIKKSKDFPKGILDDEILIKVGAQVMITRNDYDAGYSNGMVGIVSSINDDDDTVSVELENGKIVEVGISKYQTYETFIDSETKKIKSKPKAWAEQLDCKVCRAMTIHKSQGKTFDNAYIALTGWTPPGIIYVGLSRLTSLNGLGLSRPLRIDDIKVYKEAMDFLRG